MERSTKGRCLLVLLCSTASACGSGQTPADTAAATQTLIASQQELADKAKALEAALAETGNDYPVPALFVKRWNLLAQPMPTAQITTFTSRGRENDPRPIADLAGFDFTSAGSTFLQLGASGMSIEYVTIVDDPINAGAKARTNAYNITIKGHPKLDEHLSVFAQFCLWEIRSTRSSFTVRSAIRLFSDAAHDVPPSDAVDHGKHAEAEGVSLTLKKNGEYSTCEVKEGGK